MPNEYKIWLNYYKIKSPWAVKLGSNQKFTGNDIDDDGEEASQVFLRKRMDITMIDLQEKE